MSKDVIIVLGVGVTPSGKLTPIGASRVEKAVALWKDGYAKTLLLSGAWSHELSTIPVTTEARAMQAYALALGVPETSLLLEESSKFTLANAYYSRLLLESSAMRSAIVVTSDFHMLRTKYVFTKVFGSGFRLSFVGATSKITEIEWYIRRKTERSKLDALRQYLDPVAEGDVKAIERFIEQADLRIREKQTLL